MLEFLVSLSAPTYKFDYVQLAGKVRTEWPDAFYVATDDLVWQRVSTGQWQLPSRVLGDGLALISPQPNKQAIGVDSRSYELAARYIALVTTLPGFPDTGEVVLLNWNDGEYEPLRPNMTPVDILAIPHH